MGVADQAVQDSIGSLSRSCELSAHESTGQRGVNPFVRQLSSVAPVRPFSWAFPSRSFLPRIRAIRLKVARDWVELVVAFGRNRWSG